MKDEKYLFVSDSINKKRTARGAHNRGSHGGKVKMPSDFLSKKELKSMDGECKTYRLNEPMSWEEFKALPDDLKVSYINAIRIRFGASDSEIFRMFGVDQRKGAYDFAALNLGRGRNSTKLKFNQEAWSKWRAGIKVEADIEDDSSVFNAKAIIADEEPVEAPEPVVMSLPTNKTRVYPLSGHMTLRGTAEEIGSVIAEMLGGGKLILSVEWEME